MRKSLQSFVLSGVLASITLGGMSMSPVSYAADYSRTSSLEQRVTRLEKMAQNPVLLQLLQRMETQESELQELQDRVDRLQRDLEQLKAKESKHYQESDERLSVLETQLSDIQKRLSAQALDAGAQPLQAEESMEGAVPSPSDKTAAPSVAGPQETNLPVPTASQPPAPAPKLNQSAQVKQVTPATPITTHFPTDEEKSAYKAAFNLVKRSKYDQAIKKFKDFQKRYPASKLAANAAYWEGEVYLLKKQNEAALKAFDKVLNLYPDSLKRPDALLRKADTLVLLGKKEEAKSLYETLRRDYPKSRAAKNVAKRLEILGEDDGNADKANASGGKK
jgi:tol-pal system protein YbgF